MSDKRLWCLSAVVALVLTLVVSGPPGRAAPTQGGTLVIGLDQEPPTLDPHASPSAVTYQIISSVTENLLYQGPDGKIMPWLATSYKLSPDGKSFTFTLDKNIKFTDGAPLNAAAVKWNFDRIVDPNFKAGGALVALTGYAGSTVIDENTVQVNFKAPYAPFLVYAAGGTLSLISPKSTPTQGDVVNQKPVGSGPYIISEYVPKDHITMVRNPQYNRRAPWSDHAGPPYLDRITWKIIPEAGTRTTTLETGETQVISALSVPAAVLRRLEGSKTFTIDRTPYPGAPRIWLLNVKLAPTDDLKVRQALNYGVSRASFVESIYKGLGRQAYAPLTMYMLDDPSLRAAYPYNPVKAAQLLEEAGWKMGPDNIRQRDGKPLSLLINSINYGGGNLPEIELLQGQLFKLGIDAKIKSQARPPWYEDNYHCATNGPVMFLRAVDWDGLFALFGSENVGGNFNWSCYSNPAVDRLLADGRTEFDPAKRKAIYLKIQQILIEQAVTVPLVDEFAVWVMRSNVKGVKYNYSAYPVLSDTYLEK
ncbi:MAG TPA: ABC transporter substrate-binding protein [bacterium]|nr:ABC transporter substrate-binding protein [bacterium]